MQHVSQLGPHKPSCEKTLHVTIITYVTGHMCVNRLLLNEQQMQHPSMQHHQMSLAA